jgi:hypothetical protein
VRINEELLERKSSGSGLENRLAVVGNSRADHATPLYPQKFDDHWRRGDRSVGIVRLRAIKATEFVLYDPTLLAIV